MAQHNEHDIVNAVVAAIRLRRGEDGPKMAAFRLPKQLREQLQEAAAVHQVSMTDVVVQSLKTILPHLLRQGDQPSTVSTRTVRSLGNALSDFDTGVCEEVGMERRSW